MFLDPVSYSNIFNIVSILITWIVVWFILGGWFDKSLKATATVILTLPFYLAILVLYNVPLTFSNYLTWLAAGFGVLFSSIGSILTQLRRLEEIEFLLEALFNLGKIIFSCKKMNQGIGICREYKKYFPGLVYSYREDLSASKA